MQDSPIRWTVRLTSSPEIVYAMLATDAGRARFWAESAVDVDGRIHFRFPNGATWTGCILDQEPGRRLAVEYYGGSRATFFLTPLPMGGTDLTVVDEGVSPEDRCDVLAGWVSVLLALKAAVDYGVDLRNHDPEVTWDQGYADN
jgi:uncharacterized protein YndB with AHSA1/START domain